MTKAVVLFRVSSPPERDEMKVAAKYFPVLTSRMDCKDQLVIGRYSVLPFYRELEKDLAKQGSWLINTESSHCWIADFAYYEDMRDYTPWSYSSDNFYMAPEGQYVVKGRTNSRKHKWRTQMFAETKRDAIRIGHELLDDALIGTQGIIYREYVPLKILETCPISGLPFSNEWRFFFYKDQMLSHGYYWSSSADETIAGARMDQAGLQFATRVAKIAAEFADFFVLDIAEKASGGWILIEINDGQMSGLSENNADALYSNLKVVLS